MMSSTTDSDMQDIAFNDIEKCESDTSTSSDDRTPEQPASAAAPPKTSCWPSKKTSGTIAIVLLSFGFFAAMVAATTVKLKKAKGNRSETPITDAVSTQPIEKIVIFGDSFSDTGNIWAASNFTVPQSPPYWNGHYCNGRVYVDFLQEILEADVENLAWGGATTDSALISGYSTFMDGPVPAVNDQVATYLQSNNSAASESTLYVLFSGYNDYWWWVYRNMANATEEVSTDELDALAQNVSKAIVENMWSLYYGNNQAQRFLVADLPPLQTAPEANGYPANKLEAYQYLTERHNTLLQEKLDDFEIRARGVVVQTLGVHNVLATAINDPASEGFALVDGKQQEACLSSSDSAPCSDSFGSIYWDLYHPTTHIQFLVAEAALDALEIAN